MNRKPTVSSRFWLAVLLAGWMAWAPVPAAQAEGYGGQSSATSDLVTGAACFIVTPVYGAFKLTFAGLGAITGGLAWVFTGGDRTVAEKIWNTSMRGTYVITPDHLAGRRPIEFVGDP